MLALLTVAKLNSDCCILKHRAEDIPEFLSRKFLACNLLNALGMKRVLTIAMVILLPVAGFSKEKSPRITLIGLSEEWVLRAQQGEPSLLDVERMALVHAQLDSDPAREWRKKSRLSAALPNLSVGVETGYLNRANFNVQDSIAVNSSGVTIGPEANNTNQYATNQTMVTARATWSLPDVVFHRQTLAIEREIRNRMSDREKLSEKVSAVYHERLRLKSILLATRQNPQRHTMDRISIMAALQKVTGDLNLLTGGWFDDQLKGAGS